MPVQMRTILEVADNSGAKRLACILPLGGATGLKAGLGDIITASVKEASPDSNVKKGSVVKCVIVRTRKETRRKDGTYIRFDTNAAVLQWDFSETFYLEPVLMPEPPLSILRFHVSRTLLRVNRYPVRPVGVAGAVVSVADDVVTLMLPLADEWFSALSKALRE